MTIQNKVKKPKLTKDEAKKLRANVCTTPSFLAATTISSWETSLDYSALNSVLKEQNKDLANGSMKRAEEVLLSQVHTLDTLFNNLASQARHKTVLPQFEAFLRLAFKAQNQCRQTIETLSAIKNPPVIFAKQANINNGNQQINNGVNATQAENQKTPNELLTEIPNATLDRCRTKTAIGAYSELEAVVISKGSHHTRG